MSKSRGFASAALAGALVIAGLSAGPAFADDPPPLVWSNLPGFPQTVDDVTVTWETASATDSPFGGDPLMDPLPVLRVDIVNNSTEVRHFGMGTDFVTQGEVDHLWTPEAWGAFAGTLSDIEDTFWLTLQPGQSLSTFGGDASTWYTPLPAWSGHTLQIFSLNEAPSELVVPTATVIAEVVVPGRFVGANLGDSDLSNPSAIIGKRAAVDGGGGSPALFPGVSASVTASGLTPGEELEVWIAPNLDYFSFVLLGGGLPAGAVHIGSDVVDALGEFSTAFTLDRDLAFGGYQLVAGVRAERYWPAGTWEGFQVTAAPGASSVDTSPGQTAEIIFEDSQTQITAAYPASWAGKTTAVLTSTGPVPDGFQLASYPPVYYHLSTDVAFTGVATVCIGYDPDNLPGQVPRLYHFDAAANQWIDITTTRVLGTVCGQATSFSPFTLGYPPTFDFSGFFNPVSMTAENIAKPGQAIPVKFSLHGDKGLDVVTSARFVTEGNATSLAGEVIDTTTAGGSGLTYDARADQYTYVWKTPKTLSLKTGRFELTLSDGTVHTFNVTFKK